MPVVMLAGLLTEADKEAREALQPRECLEKPLHPQGYLRLAEALVVSQFSSEGSWDTDAATSRAPAQR